MPTLMNLKMAPDMEDKGQKSCTLSRSPVRMLPSNTHWSHCVFDASVPFKHHLHHLHHYGCLRMNKTLANLYLALTRCSSPVHGQRALFMINAIEELEDDNS